MAYINDERTAEINKALAVILRASFKTKQDNRLLIVRQVGKIGGLLEKKDAHRGSYRGFDRIRQPITLR